MRETTVFHILNARKCNFIRSHSFNMKFYQLHRYLPDPLFVIFNQARAHGEAIDKDVSVTVSGDLEEAKSFRFVTLL